MGASIGIAQLHGSEVAKELASKYEEYKAAGLPDDEIQAKLTADYSEFCKQLTIKNAAAEASEACAETAKTDHFVAAVRRSSKEIVAPQRRGSKEISQPPSRRPSQDAAPKGAVPVAMSLNKNASTPEVGVSVKKIGLGQGGPKGGDKRHNTRRRSFDNQAVLKNLPPAQAAESASVDNSPVKISLDSPRASPDKIVNPLVPGSPVPAPASAADPASAMDSWDSVTQQPFCPICHMTFKSLAFYERHVKYSDLHIKAEKKLKGIVEGDVTGTTSADPPTSPTIKRVEGIHYKLLYTGSKLFWRTQQNIDFDIFHHIIGDTIEIIAHDSLKSQDVNRLYLNYTKTLTIVKELQKISPSLMTVSSAAGAEGEDKEIKESEEEKTRNSISRYLLQRLQMDGNTKVVQFSLLSNDDHFPTPLLDTIPADIKPVAVVRRRRTNGEDFETEMQSLHADQAALVASVEAAKDP